MIKISICSNIYHRLGIIVGIWGVSSFSMLSAKESNVPRDLFGQCFHEVVCQGECKNNSSLASMASFYGNKEIPTSELDQMASHFITEEGNYLEGVLLGEKISAFYACVGMINSGAVFEGYSAEKRVYVYNIIEGKINAEDIHIKFNDDSGLDVDPIKQEIMGGDSEKTLNYNDIRERLELLKNNPQIKSVRAEISPKERGKARLDITVLQAKPMQWQVGVNNYQHKSVGQTQVTLDGTYYLPKSLGRSIGVSASASEGTRNVQVGYSDRGDKYGVNSTWSVGGGHKESVVVDEPFDKLEIRNDTNFVNLTYRHDFRKNFRKLPEDNGNGEYALSNTGLTTTLEVSESTNTLLDEPFSFSLGQESGKSIVTSLQSSVETEKKTRRQAYALSGGVDLGLGLFGATIHDGDAADSRYIALKSNAEYRGMLPDSDRTQFGVKASAQYTEDALLVEKKVGIGGEGSVRGVGKNLLSVDSGMVINAQVSTPITTLSPFNVEKISDGRVFASAFVDYGVGRNNYESPDPLPKDDERQIQAVATVGLGTTWEIGRDMSLDMSWGKPVYSRGFDEREANDIEDGEFYFQLVKRFRE